MSSQSRQSRGLLILLFHLVSPFAINAQSAQESQVERVDAGDGAAAKTKTGLDLVLVQKRLFKETNEFRKQQKREPLKANSKLDQAAQAYAEYLADTEEFSHTADGKQPWDRTAKAGYEHAIILENIAYQEVMASTTVETLAQDIERGWENSPGHRKNLLDVDVLELGIGLARSSGTGRYYAVQNFGRPRSATISFQVINRTDMAVQYSIDGQSFSAEPRYTITYERSRPPELKFLWDETAKVSEEAQKVIRPVNDASYTIRMTDEDTITVESK